MKKPLIAIIFAIIIVIFFISLYSAFKKREDEKTKLQILTLRENYLRNHPEPSYPVEGDCWQRMDGIYCFWSGSVHGPYESIPYLPGINAPSGEMFPRSGQFKLGEP